MKQLWAPWRMGFILQNQQNKSTRSVECIFCSKPKEPRDWKNYVLYRGAHVFVMLNIYPYNNGHLLVSPYLHAKNLAQLDRTILTDLMLTTQLSVSALEAAVSPDGFNIGVNLGKAAGAGIEDHLHIHIVPRWAGDTSYMPVLSEVRVIPEHLNATYEILLPHFMALRAIGHSAAPRQSVLEKTSSKKTKRRKAKPR